jgi:hypothetical protein
MVRGVVVAVIVVGLVLPVPFLSFSDTLRIPLSLPLLMRLLLLQ